MGGSGGGIAYNREELVEDPRSAASISHSVHEVLIEESVLGWKEFEMEVMRAIRPVTPSSSAPLKTSIPWAFTLVTPHHRGSRANAHRPRVPDDARCLPSAASTRSASYTGGSNVQFAINPENGRMVVVEMNPRVSRSSALASKATGFPIAKIAAKLAVGYRLDEIRNDITRATPACFEPTIDYVVVKIPRWQFEKFPGAEPVLNTQMKSVGEVMAIGRTFKQALGKGMRSLETGKADGGKDLDVNLIPKRLITPNPDRLEYIRFAIEQGYTVAQIHEMTRIDPWFLTQIAEVVQLEQSFPGRTRLTRLLRVIFARPSATGSATAKSPASLAPSRWTCAPLARIWVCMPYSIASIRARPSLKASLPTCTRVTSRKTKQPPTKRRRS